MHSEFTKLVGYEVFLVYRRICALESYTNTLTGYLPPCFTFTGRLGGRGEKQGSRHLVRIGWVPSDPIISGTGCVGRTGITAWLPGIGRLLTGRRDNLSDSLISGGSGVGQGRWRRFWRPGGSGVTDFQVSQWGSGLGLAGLFLLDEGLTGADWILSAGLLWKGTTLW